MIVGVILAFIIGFIVFRKTLFERFLLNLFGYCHNVIAWSYSKSKGIKEKGEHNDEIDDERNDIHIQNDGILGEIKRKLKKLEQLGKNKEVIIQNKAKIVRNKDFTYEVEGKEKVLVTRYLDPSRFYTSCLACNFPCHEPCTEWDECLLYKCVAMENRGDPANAKCLKCPRRCGWQQHRNIRSFEAIELQNKSKSSVALLKEYRDSEGKIMEVSEITELLDEECEAIVLIIIGLIEIVRKNLVILNGKAPNITEYIGILINSETSSEESGWKHRVQSLNGVKEKAEYLAEEAKRGHSPVELYKNRTKEGRIKIWSEVETFLKMIEFPSFS